MITRTRMLAIGALLAVTVFLGAAETTRHSGEWATLFTEPFINAEGKGVDLRLKDKLVALYFGNAWDPASIAFTAKLQTFHAACREHIEIIYISFDRTSAQQLQTMKTFTVPWLSVPLGGADDKRVKIRFATQRFPALLVFDPDGGLLTMEGRMDVEFHPENAILKWVNIIQDVTAKKLEAAQKRTLGK